MATITKKTKAPRKVRAGSGTGPDDRGRVDRLVVENLGLVHAAARRLQRFAPGVPREELVSAGTLGLIMAAERFDVSRGLCLTTFAAHRIRGAILDELRSRNGWRRTTVRARRKLQRGQEAAERVRRSKVGIAEIAAEIGITETECWALRDRAATREVSFEDVDFGVRRRLTVAETVADPTALDFERQVETAELLELVRDAMAELTPDERDVLTAYYIRGLPYRVIGQARGVTESRICQICRAAVRRLRGILATRMGTTAVTSSDE